jgi:glycosyltransferase involved in cell wall biosynthesis
VLPSHQENFGIVVAEAMAAGRPVLITDKVNTWREVKASGGGFVETDDAAGITRLLQRFLAQTLHERVEMGQLARKGFIDYFNLDQGLKSIDRVLMEAVREQTTACQ